MLSLEKIKEAKTDQIGFFRFKKFDTDTYLITNDVGKFAFLTVEEFENFISGLITSWDKYQELLEKGFIKNPNYENTMIYDMALRNHFVWIGPTLHMIITTLRCNHHCKYCHAAVAPMSAKNLDMTLETAEKVLDTIFHTNAPAFTIEFQWWESLVNWDVVKFIVENARARAMHFKKIVTFAIVTNLTLMTEEKLDWLIDNHVAISTSLDGDEKNHNNNRTWYNGNSYEKVVYWIKRVQQRYAEKKVEGTKIWALLTLTKENINDYKPIIHSYIDLGLSGIFLRWLNPYWFAASDLNTLMYDEDEWISMYKESMDYILELNKSWTRFKEQMSLVYLRKILLPEDPAFMDIRSPSGIAIWGVAYNYDGKVYASDESRMLWRMWIEDFLMTEMKETWASTYLDMMNSDITKIAVQSTCLDGLPGFNDHVYKPYVWVDIIHNFKTTWNIYVPLALDKKMKIQFAILDYLFEKLRDEEAKKIFIDWLER